MQVKATERVIRYKEYDYAGILASTGIYGIHKFPAMLHFKVVESLIDEFSSPEEIVYDPFCGSGVTLNVAIRKERNAIGTDINPLALLIAEVRSLTNINPEEYIKELLQNWEKLTPEIPKVKNLNYWFKDYVVEELGKIRSFLLKLPPSGEKKFLSVVFSQTVRDVSLTRKGEFKRYRMKPSEIEKFSPNVLATFISLSQDYYKRLTSWPKPKGKLSLYLHDTRRPLPFNEKVDTVITSPPYGDSKTTVAYGEFSSFSLEWLQGIITLPPYNIDRKSLGGDKSKAPYEIPSFPSLEKTIEDISKRDRKRAEEVLSFYKDLFICIRNITGKLSDRATVCFIVGNRRVKKCTIPMNEIVKEMFEYFGLNHYETRVRNILNKRMPLNNSPSNKKGDKDKTMKSEFIVIMKV
ncbi:DNA methyltransferase [Phorcysia thermohydrogeniphila]|uniref:site-specific DNA-methyltransferase (cytosine-N(4)-specific) n=1 Tax=Phorcysia thermohydrogeniphila TaxID=936138 RepID=A0A4R1GB34_9BACT|nr:DNA methyltransferase [Phorcysia thermohydrogeniphila]TCK03933.1 DNA methylase [Phorcysia thermohydrogeniphila]